MDIQPDTTADDAIDVVEDGDSIDSSDPGDVYDAGYSSNWFLEIHVTTYSQYTDLV